MSFFAVCAVKNEIFAALEGMGRVGWAICSLSIGIVLKIDRFSKYWRNIWNLFIEPCIRYSRESQWRDLDQAALARAIHRRGPRPQSALRDQSSEMKTLHFIQF